MWHVASWIGWWTTGTRFISAARLLVVWAGSSSRLERQLRGASFLATWRRAALAHRGSYTHPISGVAKRVRLRRNRKPAAPCQRWDKNCHRSFADATCVYMDGFALNDDLCRPAAT